MAIEALAAAAAVKEIAAPAAVEATKQLAEKIATQSVETKALEQAQNLDQLNRMESFRLGEGADSDEKLKLREADAEEELKSKISDQMNEVRAENPESALEKIRKLMGDSGEYPSSYEERIQQTPCEGKDGFWEGLRGESKFIPTNPELKKLLSEFGRDGVEYRNGIPDFSPFAKNEVQIDNMSQERYGPDGNFEQANTKCAEDWNAKAQFGRRDWTPREVNDWRRENNYTWHECNDMKTCQLVPTDINGNFGHLGGVGECKRLAKMLNINSGDIFDA